MNKVLFIAILFSAFSFQSQTRTIKNVNSDFEHLNYWKVKPSLEKLLKQEPTNETYAYQLAYCAFQMHDNMEAYSLLRAFNTKNGFKQLTTYSLYYSICNATQHYDEAITVLEKIKSIFPKESENSTWLKHQSTQTNREQLKSTFEVSIARFNSTSADFGGYPCPDGSFLILSSQGNNMIKRRWLGNGDNFLDFYRLMENKKLVRMKKPMNSKYHEGPLCYHPNGKWVYFTRNTPSKSVSNTQSTGLRNLTLYLADVRQDGGWENIRALSINSPDYSTGHPYVDRDGKTLYFSSNRPGGFGGTDLYKATIGDDGNVINPVNLGNGINTEKQEMFPWVNHGMLFFSSDGHFGFGGLDVFVSPVSNNGTMNRVKNAGTPINTSTDDFALIFTNENSGFVSSNRGDFGSDNIYHFSQVKPIVFQNQLTLIVMEQETKKSLTNYPLVVLDNQGKIIDTIATDAKGNVSLNVTPNQTYSFKSTDPSLSDKVWEYSSTLDEKQSFTVEVPTRPSLQIIALVTEKNSKLPVDSVKIEIRNKIDNAIIYSGYTNADGTCGTKLKDLTKDQSIPFEITLSKNGYINQTVSYSHTVNRSETINLHEKIDLSVGKINIGANLADLIDIKPIYFDRGKYTIRPDASLELDKIVKIMNQYPNMVIELGSHTDCRSSVASNQTLSQNRAKASADYIKKRISKPERISGVGYGETKLIVDCPCEGTVVSDCSEELHAKNRRTEFIITKMN